MGVNMFPGIDKPTSPDRLGIELAKEHLKLVMDLRAIRLDRGMSVNDVADAIGVDAAQVSRFESGSTNPTMTTIKRYAKAVGAVFRIKTTTWTDEHTNMVKQAVEARITSSADDQSTEESHTVSYRTTDPVFGLAR